MNQPFHKLVMGVAAIAGLAFSAHLSMGRDAIWLLGGVAIACSGSQALQDLCKAATELIRVWSELRPFVLSKEGGK
ncbi:hypothetical protein [Solidesulfovibrio sp.]